MILNKGFYPWLVLCFALTGCVSTAEREHGSRALYYNQILVRLKPGATRADLQRLLPGVATPRPFDTAVFFSSPRFEPDIFSKFESYPLDADCCLQVHYAYRHTRLRYLRWEHPPALSSSPPASFNGVISADAIDQLLFPTGRPVVRIYPRPDDRIDNDFPLRVQRR